jgi:hypothetical protein
MPRPGPAFWLSIPKFPIRGPNLAHDIYSGRPCAICLLKHGAKEGEGDHLGQASTARHAARCSSARSAPTILPRHHSDPADPPGPPHSRRREVARSIARAAGCPGARWGRTTTARFAAVGGEAISIPRCLFRTENHYNYNGIHRGAREWLHRPRPQVCQLNAMCYLAEVRPRAGGTTFWPGRWRRALSQGLARIAQLGPVF